MTNKNTVVENSALKVDVGRPTQPASLFRVVWLIARGGAKPLPPHYMERLIDRGIP